MDEYVAWMFHLEVNAGRQDDLKALMQEMTQATEANEPGSMIYEWSFSSDGNTLDLYERYADSAAALVHMKTFGAKFASRFFDILVSKGMTVYGSPNAEVMAGLPKEGVVVLTQQAGFSRLPQQAGS